LSRDPSEERGGYNLYAFVFNKSNYWYDYLGTAGRPNTTLQNASNIWTAITSTIQTEASNALNIVNNGISTALGTNAVTAGIINTAAESDPTITPVTPTQQTFGNSASFEARNLIVQFTGELMKKGIIVIEK
jgi:hypothetical protein